VYSQDEVILDRGTLNPKSSVFIRKRRGRFGYRNIEKAM
jgi:hypothetical protein